VTRGDGTPAVSYRKQSGFASILCIAKKSIAMHQIAAISDSRGSAFNRAAFGKRVSE
jgi:hypothetical protein